MAHPRYAYDSAQQSLLLPLYRKFFWGPVLQWIPRSLAPNTMTLVSTLCCATSFALAASLRDHPLAMLAAAILVVAYFTLDNLDGAQARRIGRSSRLGEFLDHWLDTLNNGFVVLGAFLAAGLPGLMALGVLACGSLAFFAVQWELRHTGVFRVGRVGDIEGNTTVALLYVTLAVFGADAFQVAPVPGLPSIAIWLGLGVMGQALWTVASALRNVSHGRRDFLPHALSQVAVVGWAITGEISIPTALGLCFFLNPVFTAGPVCARLFDRATPRLDASVAIVLVAATLASLAGVSPVPAQGLALGLTLALAVLTAIHLSVAVQALREPAAPTPSGAAEDGVENPASLALRYRD